MENNPYDDIVIFINGEKYLLSDPINNYRLTCSPKEGWRLWFDGAVLGGDKISKNFMLVVDKHVVWENSND